MKTKNKCNNLKDNVLIRYKMYVFYTLEIKEIKLLNTSLKLLKKMIYQSVYFNSTLILLFSKILINVYRINNTSSNGRVLLHSSIINLNKILRSFSSVSTFNA